MQTEAAVDRNVIYLVGPLSYQASFGDGSLYSCPVYKRLIISRLYHRIYCIPGARAFVFKLFSGRCHPTVSEVESCSVGCFSSSRFPSEDTQNGMVRIHCFCCF